MNIPRGGSELVGGPGVGAEYLRPVLIAEPGVIRDGRYMPAAAPGYGIAMYPDSLKQIEYPNGPAWRR